VFSELARLRLSLLGRTAFDWIFPGRVERLVSRHELVLLISVRNVVDGQEVMAIGLRAPEHSLGRAVLYKAFRRLKLCVLFHMFLVRSHGGIDDGRIAALQVLS
jgi:hypothetical protein